jgi:hypothetical protein
MRGLRRALGAVALCGLVATVLRLMGAGETPSQQGGWRELRGPELR